MKYEMVTIESVKRLGKKTFFIRATQKYSPEFDTGHYKYYILDEGDVAKPNIIKVQSSCCSAPKGKIDQEFLREEMKEFLREYKDYQRHLKKAKI